MTPVLFTTYQRPSHGTQERVLSIFLAREDMSPEDLDAAVAKELHSLGSIDAIHFVGYENDISLLRSWLDRPGDVLLGRLLDVLGSRSEEALRLIAFAPGLGLHTCMYRDGRPISEVGLAEAERRNSLFTIFCNSGGEEIAPTGTHYAKTSEKHSDRFLRVSNVLEDGTHVQLVAFWLLPILWKTSATHLVVDTSGIYSVALTALHEISKLGGLGQQPLVWSHRSHEGVNKIPRHVAENAVFLISASTSNGLANRLMNIGAKPEQIITLFGLSNGDVRRKFLLCDLHGDGETGLKTIQNHDANNCAYCKKHFHLIDIQGDQFSISPPRVASIELKATDLAPKEKITLSALAGLGAFFVYRRRDDDRICTLGLDVQPLLSGPFHEKSQALQLKLRDKWESFMRRSETVSLRAIVFSMYPGSEQLANTISQQARHALNNPNAAQVMDSSALRLLQPQAGTSTVVVSACVDEAKELLATSRILRDVQENGATTYLSVAQLMSPKQQSELLKTNLTYGAHGPGTFSYFSALDIPVECYEDEPSWRMELVELQRLITWADKLELDIPEEIEHRIARLQQAPATGMVDDLFWPNQRGEALRLRSDFALIDGSLRAPNASQADLFAVISVVLTALRHNSDSSRRLAHSGYTRAVISPSNFDRFNDGVLQACLLRSARPKDLAYGACEDEFSERMLEILMHALPDENAPEKSEALVEFALALMTGRMSLTRRVTLTFSDALVSATSGKWPVAALMGSYLKDKFSRI